MSNVEKIISVVVADDADELRGLLIKLLSRDSRISVVGEASETLSTIDVVLLQKPDVLLLDLSMPNGGGIKVLDRLMQENLPTKVVVLSGLPKGHAMESASKNGAYSYVEKGTSFNEILHTIVEAGNSG